MRLYTLFNRFPTLETPRLTLRRLDVDDALALFEVYGDPEAMRYYDMPIATRVAETHEILRRNRIRYEQGRVARWGIVLREAGRLIGTIGFVGIYSQKHAAAIGYDLARQWWNQGYMTEAVGCVVDFGFDEIGFNRIEAMVMPGNTGSMRVLRKNGFVEEGVLRDYLYFRDDFQTVHMFSQLAREWRARRNE